MIAMVASGSEQRLNDRIANYILSSSQKSPYLQVATTITFQLTTWRVLLLFPWCHSYQIDGDGPFLDFIQAFVSHCSASISLAIKNLRDHSTRRSSPNILLRSSGLLYVHKRAQQAPSTSDKALLRGCVSYQLIRKHSPGSPFRYWSRV